MTTIRPQTPADIPAVREVVAAAFGGAKGEQVARLVDLIRRSPFFLPEFALVAEDEGAVVGHVLLSRAPLRRTDSPASDDSPGGGEVDILLLSPLAVRPDRQGHGIGSTLVRSALHLADSHGEPMVILEGNPKLYGRFGFERASDHGIERPSDRIPDVAFQVRMLHADDTAFRGRVGYPSAFWETGSVGP